MGGVSKTKRGGGKREEEEEEEGGDGGPSLSDLWWGGTGGWGKGKEGRESRAKAMNPTSILHCSAPVPCKCLTLSEWKGGTGQRHRSNAKVSLLLNPSGSPRRQAAPKQHPIYPGKHAPLFVASTLYVHLTPSTCRDRVHTHQIKHGLLCSVPQNEVEIRVSSQMARRQRGPLSVLHPAPWELGIFCSSLFL